MREGQNGTVPVKTRCARPTATWPALHRPGREPLAPRGEIHQPGCHRRTPRDQQYYL